MGLRLTDEERADRKMTEAQLNSRVMYRAKKYGWKVLRMQRATIAGAWRTPASRGFPDLLLVGPGLMFRELKKELGKLDEDQEKWRDALLAAGADWGVWRPSDLRAGRIALSLTTYPPLDNNDLAPDNLERDGARQKGA